MQHPIDYFDRLMERHSKTNLDLIMITRELRKHYKRQYDKATSYLHFLKTKLIAGIDEESELEDPAIGGRLAADYVVPEDFDDHDGANA